MLLVYVGVAGGGVCVVRFMRVASNTSRNVSGLLPLKPIVNIFVISVFDFV